MELLQEARFVRLKSRTCDKYLYADKDGRGISVDTRRALLNTVWAVDRVFIDDTLHIRLRGAYGFYLSATSTSCTSVVGLTGFKAIQDVFDEPQADTILWHPTGVASGVVLLQTASKLLLRTNNRFPLRRSTVTIDVADHMCRAMMWEVQVVPLTWTRPLLPVPINHLDVEIRNIRYAAGDERDGSVNDDAWQMMRYSDRSVMILRKKLAQLLSFPVHSIVIICTRAGRRGTLTPLLIDLPRGDRPMDFVIIPSYTRVAYDFPYPDLDTPRR